MIMPQRAGYDVGTEEWACTRCVVESRRRRIMRRLDRLVCVALGCVVLIAGAAAAESESNEEAAINAVEEWLQLIDEGKYGDSWESAADLFKRAVRKDQQQQQLEAVRNSLGTVKSRRVGTAESRTALPGVPNGEYVVIQFKSSFERKNTAVETVTPMLGDDGVWRVSGY
jgi:predicted transcriptional regulator